MNIYTNIHIYHFLSLSLSLTQNLGIQPEHLRYLQSAETCAALIWDFPKIRGSLLVIPILRIILSLGLYWGSPIYGNSHFSSRNCKACHTTPYQTLQYIVVSMFSSTIPFISPSIYIYNPYIIIPIYTIYIYLHCHIVYISIYRYVHQYPSPSLYLYHPFNFLF